MPLSVESLPLGKVVVALSIFEQQSFGLGLGFDWRQQIGVFTFAPPICITRPLRICKRSQQDALSDWVFVEAPGFALLSVYLARPYHRLTED